MDINQLDTELVQITRILKTKLEVAKEEVSFLEESLKEISGIQVTKEGVNRARHILCRQLRSELGL